MVKIGYMGALFILSFLEIFLCFVFLCYTVLDEETLSRKVKLSFTVFEIALGWLLMMNRKVAFFSQLVFLMVIFLLCLVTCVIKKEEILFTCSLVFLYYSFLALLDFGMAFFGMEFLKEEFFEIIYCEAESIWQLVVFACSRVIMLLLILVVIKRKWRITKEYERYFLIIDFAFFLLLEKYHKTIDAMALGEIAMRGAHSGISLLFISLICVSIIILILKYQIMQKENNLLALHVQMTEQKYQTLQHSAEVNKHLVHDVKHHLLNLREYIKEDNLKKIERYLDEIEKEYMEVQDKEWTGNPFLDFILNQKKNKAESKGITFEIDSECIPVWNLTDSEMSNVFGNLLDNAIEASEKVRESDRNIQIFMKKRGEIIIIRILNSIEKSPIWMKGELVSDKKNEGIHGYGLKSVRRVINKREGYFACQVDGKKFRVDINLF